MGLNSDERMARIYDLDLKRQSHLHQIELVSRDEENRRLKLRALALRDENATLKDKLSHKDTKYNLLCEQNDDIRAELEDAGATSRGKDARLKKQAIELTNLKAEIDSLNSSMQDSGKALQEKFALTRELNRLRPEMEHLQSQLSSHQAVVAERHALRRQLDSLEVELENEKRSRQRPRNKGDGDAGDELRCQLEEAEKRLAADKKEREKMKRDHEKALAAESTRRESLEERISTAKTKLKDAQTELRDTQAALESCRADLQRAQGAPLQVPGPVAVERPKKKVTLKEEPSQKRRAKDTLKQEPARKRRARNITEDDVTAQPPSDDDTINLNRHLKKRNGGQAPVGEKSTFSITPFLCRTTGLGDKPLNVSSPATPGIRASEPADEEPEGSEDLRLPGGAEEPEQPDEPEAPEAPDEPEPPVVQPRQKPQEQQRQKPLIKAKPAAPATAEAKAQNPRGRPRNKVLTETSPSKKNISRPVTETAKTSPVKKPRIAIVEKAAEKVIARAAVDDQNVADHESSSDPGPQKSPDPQTKPQPLAEAPTAPANAAGFEADGKKRKRKLLGGGNTTIFDEEDGETMQRPVKAQPAATRRLKAPLGGAPGGFGGSTFSPLKRDRRGVNASFLA